MSVKIYRTYEQDYDREWLVSDKVMVDLSEIACYVETKDDKGMPIVKMYQSRVREPGGSYTEVRASLAEIIIALDDAGLLELLPAKTKKAEEETE